MTDINALAKFLGIDASRITVVDGRVNIAGYLDLSSLTSLPEGFNPTVGGSLHLSSLTSLPEGFNPTVGGYLHLSSLTSLPEGFNPTVGGDLYLRSLTSLPEGFNPTVGGYLYLNSKIKKPHVKKPDASFHATLNASIELKFNLRGFTLADGILAKIISKRGSVKKVIIAGKNEVSYLASDEKGTHAHGATMREALAELHFKTSLRDVEQFRSMPLDTKKTPHEWALVYRAITGACKSGTNHFMSVKGKLKAKYTLAEILDQTQGAFGHDRFREIVTG